MYTPLSNSRGVNFYSYSRVGLGESDLYVPVAWLKKRGPRPRLAVLVRLGGL